MPIGWLIGLSLALVVHGAGIVIVNDTPKNGPGIPMDARVLREKFRFAGQSMFYIGLFTAIGTFIEILVR
jgi:hypothetical protein